MVIVKVFATLGVLNVTSLQLFVSCTAEIKIGSLIKSKLQFTGVCTPLNMTDATSWQHNSFDLIKKWQEYVDGLVQERRNSTPIALDLRLP